MNLLQVFFALLAVLCFLIHFIYRFFWLTYANYYGTKNKDDKKREEAVIFSASEKKWFLIDLEKNFEPELSSKEKDVQALWLAFFSAVSIKNRSNPKTQQQFMPKKYWKHLIENPGSSRQFKLK